MHEIVTTRKEGGAFKDVFDFARRAGGLGLNRKLLENSLPPVRWIASSPIERV